jgi:hypothetical protein
MRWTVAALLVLACASAASGQILWAGAAAGTSWEWQAPTAPDQNFLHSSDGAPAAFVAFPIDNETLLRLQVCDLPHDVMVDGQAWSGHLRGYTVGVDYMFPGVFGQTVFSGGLGAYQLDLKSHHPPAGVENTEFGWYLGVGEWFVVSRRARVTAQITMHRASFRDTPIIVAATGGLAFSF